MWFLCYKPNFVKKTTRQSFCLGSVGGDGGGGMKEDEPTSTVDAVDV